ncbi:MAG TPA: hypothetical protein VF151_10970 [Gemmatimonadales bacterium]
MQIVRSERLEHGAVLAVLKPEGSGPAVVYSAIVHGPDPEAGLLRCWPFPIMSIGPDGICRQVRGAPALALVEDFERSYHLAEEEFHGRHHP